MKRFLNSSSKYLIIKLLLVVVVVVTNITAISAKENLPLTKAINSSKEKNPPNIIVMLTDDQRWDALGFAGNKLLKTPNIDRLAKRGIYFENAFVTTPICCASRANVLTGQYASRNGVPDFFNPIKLETTYSAILKENGYYTGFIGKWGTLETDTAYFENSASLFDFWAGSMGQANYWHERDCNYVRNNGTTEKHSFYCDCPSDKRGVAGEGIRVGKKDIKDPVHLSTEVIPHKMRQFFNQMNKDKPFCMSISFKSPHGPWSDFDERYKNSFKAQSMPIAKSVDLEDALSRPEFLRVSLNGNHMIEKVKSKDDKNGKLQNSMRAYYKLVKGIDNSIGQIVDELKKRELFENTVIIFLSDNGQFMAEHGFHGKWLMYEESIRVPFFIFDPRQPKENRGILSDEMVLNIDVAPTVLDIAGIDIPSSMQGKSLTNLVEKPNQDFREHIFIEHMYGHGKKENHIERSWAVRSKEWKYIKYKDQTGPVSEELYNLSSDPLEMNDLSDHEEYMDKLEELRKHFNNYLISVK